MIRVECDGTVAGNQMPGAMTFHTNAGTTSTSERLRIQAGGTVETKGELWVGGSVPVLRWRDSTHGEKATARISGSDLYFEVSNQERFRIESGGTLFSKSPSDATPNFKFISDDTNWHGYLNQTVHGGTISTILSCGGTWTVDGTTYNATKDYNGSFGTAALIVHNQYSGTATGGELVLSLIHI